MPATHKAVGTVGAVLDRSLIWRSPTMSHLGVFDLEKTTEMDDDPLQACPELLLYRLLMQDLSNNRGFWQLDQEFDSNGALAGEADRAS